MDIQLWYASQSNPSFAPLTNKIVKKKWRPIENANGDAAPSRRLGHNAVVTHDGSSMFLIGGHNKVVSFDEIYEFHFGIDHVLFVIPPLPFYFSLFS